VEIGLRHETAAVGRPWKYRAVRLTVDIGLTRLIVLDAGCSCRLATSLMAAPRHRSAYDGPGIERSAAKFFAATG